MFGGIAEPQRADGLSWQKTLDQSGRRCKNKKIYIQYTHQVNLPVRIYIARLAPLCTSIFLYIAGRASTVWAYTATPRRPIYRSMITFVSAALSYSDPVWDRRPRNRSDIPTIGYGLASAQIRAYSDLRVQDPDSPDSPPNSPVPSMSCRDINGVYMA